MNTVLKIALGVFLGLIVAAMVTCAGLALTAGAVIDAAHDQAQKDRVVWEAKLAEQRKQQRATRARPTNQPPVPAPLAADERCIGGKKFRRLENGWEQLPAGQCSR